MHKVIIFFIGFHCVATICRAQDTITTTDLKVIKAKSEIIVGRYFSNLLNTISYAEAEPNEIKELIDQSFKDSAKQLFLNEQVAITDDISNPDYSGSSNAPDLPAVGYLNSFNTFYGKSDSNSVFISDVSSSQVKKGRKNMYINVFFTSWFKNKCLSHPSTPYMSASRVAEIFIKRSKNNKWLLYISRIGFLNPADTLNDHSDNVVVTEAKTLYDPLGLMDETLEPADRFNLYIIQARVEENKRNYAAAIKMYSRAIELAPDKREVYEPRITELNVHLGLLRGLQEKYKAGDYKAAIKGYTELLKKPELNTENFNSDYYLGRAKCFDKMGELTKSYNEQVAYYDNAMRDYDKSYEYDKDNLETIQCRADLNKRMN
jgi:tetratricopeptide (TPR) repeat protein